MRPFLVLASLLVLAAPAAASPVSLVNGWPGVASPTGSFHYVTKAHGADTTVSKVRTRDRHVVASRVVKGSLGVARIAIDGSTTGVSGDGRTLVLSSQPSHDKTRFVALSTSSLAVRSTVSLDGLWSLDALSPDGGTMYLIRYGDGYYEVRSYSLTADELNPNIIVDKREIGELMTGYAVARVEPRGGGWAYTLYARPGKTPFVHALETRQGYAICIDLPWKVPTATAEKLRLKLDGSTIVVTKAGGARVATIDTSRYRAVSIRRP
jgi:hypothetical protein